jgi:hypothetical protein
LHAQARRRRCQQARARAATDCSRTGRARARRQRCSAACGRAVQRHGWRRLDGDRRAAPVALCTPTGATERHALQQSATRCSNRAPRVATERHALQQSATRCNERGLHAAETVRSILRRLETYAAATVSASVRPAAMDALAERTTARRNAGCAQSRWRPGKQRGTDAAAMRHATWQGGARGRARLRCAACESATPRQGTRHALWHATANLGRAPLRARVQQRREREHEADSVGLDRRVAFLDLQPRALRSSIGRNGAVATCMLQRACCNTLQRAGCS